MNEAPTTCAIGPCRANSKTPYTCHWRSFLTAFLLLGAIAANATTFTFNNTGCQSVKVYKVFLLFETYQTTVDATHSYTTSSASWSDKYVYRSMSGNYLGEYTIPWVSSCNHDFNSGGGPSAPVVGNLSHPTCSALGSLTLSGLPTGNWTITRNPGGVTTTGTGSSVTVSGLDAGTYSFSVNKVGCTASASVNAVLNAPPTASSAPSLYSFTATNICPTTTVNLNSLVPLFTPSGFTLSWHTGTPATASNKVSNPGSVSAGTYYATFYNASANCYSGSKTTKVTAVTGNCDGLVRNKYRSIDGSMNNLSNTATVDYGKVGSAFSRELPAGYADGISSLAGPNRPNPRAISNKLSAEREDIHNDRDMAGLFYSWGQFIDHDMTANRTNSADPAPISLPSNESIFTNPIAFSRSMAYPGTGVTSPREQTNTNTAWLDASQVYGRTSSHALWIRSGVLGKLKTSEGNMLPFNTITGEYDSAIDPTAPRMDDDQGGTKKTFVAGDNRVAEHPGLTSLHTVFLREHNRICDRLVAQGLIDDEEIYQKARKEVGALIQHITYSQWISSLGVSLKPYSGYKPNVKADILNTFSAAAYRWHTMVENDIIFRDNECQGVGPVELPLKDVFFNIDIVRNYDIGVLLKGLSVHRSYETDLKVNNGLRNFLGGNFGTDLVSINIQRGRDHGLPTYNEVRKLYTGSAASSFSDITSVDTTAQKMQELYGSVDNIDLWVGLMAEDHLSGKSIGKTIDAIIRTQFENLRDGDYYYYTNDPELSGILSSIQSTKLGDLISRNSGAGNFQDNVFFRKHCSNDGDDIAHHPCSVTPQFEGWTYLGKVGSKTYFKWNGGSLNFGDASEKAISIGGHLPQVKTSTENTTIKGYLGTGTAWLDMVRDNNSWRYTPTFNLLDVLVPGSLCSYFNWKFGEPNNSGGNENRTHMASDGKWNDIPHSALHSVIAEVPCNNNPNNCKAGIAAPTLKTIYKSNVCPATTASLASVIATNKPANVTMTWHTGTPATNSNKFTAISALAAGTYYAAFFDASGSCYSPTASIKVTINTCDPCAANNYAIECEKNIGNAGWLIVADCNVSVCPGEKVMLSVNPNGYPTTWTGPNGFTANTNDILVGTSVILANAGSYTATVNVNGCIKTKTITLQVRDTDGDGICNENDCQPTNPAYPATPGTACNDGNANTSNDVVTADGCGCAGTVANPCANAGGDTDGDGVCNNNDCQPNNPAFPATPGTACNDGNANTTNDVVTANGCGCAGTPANNNPDCANIVITATSTGVTVTGLNGAPVSSLQIFTTTWQQQFNCFANCGASQTVNLPSGSYLVYAKYYTAGYALICEKQVTVTVGGNNGGPCANLGGDTDGDGVCNNNDCQPNNPAYPATPGTACNDGNANTINDVITANGCGCAGTPVAPVCDNITNGGTIGFGSSCLASTQHCPTNGAAPAITNCAAPSGGTGNLEVVWLKSTTSCVAPTTTAAQIAAGLDPHWSMIPGATGLTLDPGSVSANTCYLRCVRRAGCDVFIESNIISLTIQSNCGGGNNGTPNCANITITPGNGNITVGGLGGAPIVSVQVFSATWQQLHNCFANCGSSTATYPVPTGAYYVYVKYYTAGYQLICEQNQTVNVSVSLASNSSNGFKFDVNKQLEHTELIWLHNGDYLVDEYIVERSTDGNNFEEISFQVSEKDATADVYNDYDLEPVTGDNYYRIKLLNADGTTSYSEVKLVRFEAVEDFSIFPNPANSFTSLNLEQYIGKQVDIHIFDNKGLRMKTFQVDEIYGKYFQMDLRDLHEGHYIVWVNTPGKRPVAKKMVIGRV